MGILGKQVFQVVASLIAIALAVWYFAWRTPPEFFQQFSYINYWYVVLGAFGYALFVVLSTIRWGFLLTKDVKKLPWGNLLSITAIAKGLGSVTPMNAGEFLKAEMSHKLSGGSRGSQYGIVAVERVMDVATLLIFATVGILAQTEFRERFLTHLEIVLGLFVICVVVGVFALKVAHKRITKLRTLIDGMAATIRITANSWIVPVVTIVQWIVIGLLWIALAKAFDVTMPVTDALVVLSLVTFIMVASFLPGGVGIADIGASEIALALGYSNPECIAIVFAIRLNTFISLFIGITAYLLRKFRHT
ncbi:MAG: flippase-like domain-containing protein [bacterium]|nr:flippase-like domain-containing protein [bacterium]